METNKISVAMIAANLEINGISSVIMNYCSDIDLERFQVTVIAGHNIAPLYRKQCKSLGIELLELPHRKKQTWKYYIELYKVLKNTPIDIAHVHGSQSAIAIELFIAYINGIKIRIAHCHNTTCKSRKVHNLLKPLFKLVYTHGFACGRQAGEWLFGSRPFTVIPNGFPTEKFRFNKAFRSEIRSETGLQEKFVIGHVGRFNDQKNQTYLLKIFEILAEERKDAVLLMVGTGPMLEEIRRKIEVHPYKERVILYGETTVPEKLYMAMDLFVFPSLFEGLPVTLLEAQVSGLPCVISQVITQEAALSNKVTKLSVREEPRIWSDKIRNTHLFPRYHFYNEHLDSINKYNIKININLLENIYESLMKQCRYRD